MLLLLIAAGLVLQLYHFVHHHTSLLNSPGYYCDVTHMYIYAYMPHEVHTYSPFIFVIPRSSMHSFDPLTYYAYRINPVLILAITSCIYCGYFMIYDSRAMRCSQHHSILASAPRAVARREQQQHSPPLHTVPPSEHQQPVSQPTNQ